MSAIYSFYEDGILLPEKTPKGFNNYSYFCKTCREKGLKKNVEDFTYKCDKCKILSKIN